jgi:hypothetical protein
LDRALPRVREWVTAPEMERAGAGSERAAAMEQAEGSKAGHLNRGIHFMEESHALSSFIHISDVHAVMAKDIGRNWMNLEKNVHQGSDGVDPDQFHAARKAASFEVAP